MTKIAVNDALERLYRHEGTFINLFSHGTLAVEIYKPDKVDLQKRHTRDEIYVIATGSGEFICGDERRAVGKSDFLFAAAGVEHRFEDFTDDFSAWVFFYGPEGGELDSV
jgi:mannose-6-phosphate isomerase-like protein (cupin superfamily)